jgi:hypothetical protein
MEGVDLRLPATHLIIGTTSGRRLEQTGQGSNERVHA